ncbi:MAG TPA: flavin reductase family protein [Methanoculleus sp.]|nr:flavin reductase family protein [Methanoculleus sp.]
MVRGKTELGPVNCLYPLPTTLVGVNVSGKPNYITIAHVGILDFGSISLGMSKTHYTNAGIRENGTFSVNIPSVNMVRQTDYCGLVSGKKVDKSALFRNFYGTLGTAPMIHECPVNMECRLIRTVDFPAHDIFIGKIENTFCDPVVITDGTVDVNKVQPILFSMNDRSYYRIGARIGRAWEIGKELMRIALRY